MASSSSSSSSSSNKTVNLNLDADEDAPRRLLLLPSGEILAYGGDDGIITCLTTTTTSESNGSNDNDASVIQRYDDGVRAVAVSKDGKRVAVGFDDGRTQLYSFDDYDYKDAGAGKSSHPFCQAASKKSLQDQDALFSQDLHLQETIPSIAGPSFDSPIRDLQFHPTQQYALAIASEATVCVVDATDSTTMTTRYLQHEAEQHHDHCGIRGVSFGDDDLLCTLAMDGRLCVWLAQGPPATWKLLEREAQTCIPQKDVGEILGASVADRSCRPLSSAGYIATPGNVQVQLRKIVRLNNTTSLEKIHPSSDDGHVESIVCLARFKEWLVTSGRDANILVWKISSEGLSLETTLASDLESMPTDLMVHDNTHTLYVISANGSCVLLELPKSSSDAMAQERAVRLQANKEERKRVSKQVKDNKTLVEDDDSDIDFADAASPTSKVRFIEEDAIEDVDADDLDETVDPKNTTRRDGLDREDVEGDDFANPEHDHDDDDFDDEHRPYISPHRYSTAPIIPPQAAFAPSSTPLDLDRRFLCWNHVGAVTLLHGEDNTRNTVDISFTDSAFRRPISFTDNINFILGSLGEDGGIFASDLQQEEEHDDEMDEIVGDLNVSERTKSLLKKSQRKRMNKDPNKPMGSSVFFYRFETFGSLRDKDWYLTLPDGERVMGSACGEGWAGVVTSRRFLRIFSSGGNQGQVVWLKGEPVTMAGRGCFAAVFYHEGTPLPDGTQQMGYTLYDAVACRIISKGSVSCISKGSSLSWVGFSNDCSLMAMDTDGMMSMLVATDASSDNSFEWAPVLDTVGMRKSADDQFWPVTVYDGKLVCVPLKGGNNYPDAARRPVTATLGMRLPLARSSIAKNTTLEELSVRSNIALNQKKILNEAGGGDLAQNEDFEQEYLALSAQVDKVTLKLFASTVDAGKLERALDLVDRLHLEKSYDLAITLADRHHKLADFIEGARERRFAVDAEEEDNEEDDSPSTTRMRQLESSRQISPEANAAAKKRSLGGFQPNPISTKRRVNL